MYTLVKGKKLLFEMVLSNELGEGPLSYLGLHLGPTEDGVDWQVQCPTLRGILTEGFRLARDHTVYENAPIRFSIAADYIEDYPDSVSLYRKWGAKKTLPPTTEFLALVLRSVVE